MEISTCGTYVTEESRGLASCNREDTTVFDVWDFATGKGDDDSIGEPPSGVYDSVGTRTRTI